MPTKTETKTKEKEQPKVMVKAVAKVVSTIRQWKDAANKVTALFDTLGQIVAEESAKLKYDESQTREMVLLSLESAYDFKGNEKEQTEFRQRYRPEVSKILRMAFPADAKAVKQVELAREHNEDASLHDRIGANDLLEIARGNKTFSQVKDHKRAKKSAAKKSDKYTKTDLRNELGGLFSKADKAGFDLDDVQSAFDEIMEQWEEKSANAEKDGKDESED